MLIRNEACPTTLPIKSIHKSELKVVLALAQHIGVNLTCFSNLSKYILEIDHKLFGLWIMIDLLSIQRWEVICKPMCRQGVKKAHVVLEFSGRLWCMQEG